VRHGLIAETVIDVLEDAEDLPTGVSVSSMLPGSDRPPEKWSDLNYVF
jgi:hypothetical protein